MLIIVQVRYFYRSDQFNGDLDGQQSILSRIRRILCDTL